MNVVEKTEANQVDEKTLKRIAEISRLKLAEGELEELRAEINEILEHFSRVKEIEERGEEVYYTRRQLSKPRKDVAEKREGESKAIRKGFVREEEDYMLAPRSL